MDMSESRVRRLELAVAERDRYRLALELIYGHSPGNECDGDCARSMLVRARDALKVDEDAV